MSSDSTTIRTLQINQRMSSIRLKTLRVGQEIACGYNLSMRIRKLIMMDSEGTRIAVVMFNEDIDNHASKFEMDKTYLICIADVRKVDQRFPNVHSEKELILKKYTVIKETLESIDLKIHYNFIEFKDIKSKFYKNEEFDIYGALVKVEDSKLVLVGTTSNTKSKTVREITIINKESQYMVIGLWEDMAINEGDKLQKLVTQNPIIVISNVTSKRRIGYFQAQSTVKSILQISPECQEIDITIESSCKMYDPLRVTESMMIQDMTQVKEVTLKDLRENQHMLKESYYCFMGIVDGVQNISSIWYDSCKKCSTSCPKNGEIATCKKCKMEVVETTPRYRIILNVIQGDYNAHITLFEDVAAVYVGCFMDDYISSLNQGENESAYYRGLSLQNSTEICFLIASKSVKTDNKGNLIIIASAIQKLKRNNIDEETPVQESQTDQNGGKKKSGETVIPTEEETNEVGGKKKLIKRAKTIEVEENKRAKKKIKTTQVEEKKKSNAELELDHEEQENGKRRITKKKFQDCIDILSDVDDDNFLSKSKIKKGIQSIKI